MCVFQDHLCSFSMSFQDYLIEWISNKSDFHITVTVTVTVTFFNELFSEESCSVIGLSEKMGLQL